SIRRVESRKFSVEGGKHFVDDNADQAQRMVPRHPLLEVHIREQFTRPHIRTAHRCLPLFPPPAWNQIRSSMSAVHFFSSLLGVFTETIDGEFGLTPLGATLRSDALNSLRDQALFETSACIWMTWGQLVGSLRSGQPSFASVNKLPLFDYLAEHPETGAVFNRSMTMQSKLQNAAIVANYDFSEAQTVVDVGGGHGALAAVLAQYPALHGVL